MELDYEDPIIPEEDDDQAADDIELIDIEAIFRQARRTHEIDESDVQAILASADDEQAERLYEQLQKLGIRVVTKSGEEVDDFNESGNLLDLDDEDNGAVIDNYYTAGVQDDPVHTYLKEIGQVPLLTAEHEIWLSVQLAASNTLEELTAQAAAQGGHENQHVLTMLINYEHLLKAWRRAEKAATASDIDLPNIAMLILEAQQLRRDWRSNSPSYLRHYLN